MKKYNSVAEMFRDLMNEKGMSTYALAKKAGVGESHAKKLISGDVRNPGKATVEAVLGVLAPGKTIKYTLEKNHE